MPDDLRAKLEAKILVVDDELSPNRFVTLLADLNKLPSVGFADAKIFCCVDAAPKMFDDGLSLDGLWFGTTPPNVDFPNRLSVNDGCTVPFSCSGFGSIFELNLVKILGLGLGEDFGDGTSGTLKTGSSSSRNGV